MAKAATKQIPSEESFYRDLKELRTKYPMCYIEAWTPEDFDMERGEGDSTNWGQRIWTRVASRLSHEFDAERGTNWARVEEMVGRFETGR